MLSVSKRPKTVLFRDCYEGAESFRSLLMLTLH